MQNIWLKLELKLKNGEEQQRRQLGAVEEAQINESDIELQGWKSCVRSPARQKEHKRLRRHLS